MEIIDWLIINWIEVFGVISGLLFLYFEIKENYLMWPLGLISSALYLVIFFKTKFYADMSLQIYYVAISLYGWYYWTKGGKTDKKEDVPIQQLKLKEGLMYLIISGVLFYFYSTILVKYTDSPLPYWDSFTTALSIVATFMLTRKIKEQWLVWIVVDAVSMSLYIQKELYPTAILFVVYTALAIYGYVQWQKSYKNLKTNNE